MKKIFILLVLSLSFGVSSWSLASSVKINSSLEENDFTCGSSVDFIHELWYSNLEKRLLNKKNIGIFLKKAELISNYRNLNSISPLDKILVSEYVTYGYNYDSDSYVPNTGNDIIQLCYSNKNKIVLLYVPYLLNPKEFCYNRNGTGDLSYCIDPLNFFKYDIISQKLTKAKLDPKTILYKERKFEDRGKYPVILHRNMTNYIQGPYVYLGGIYEGFYGGYGSGWGDIMTNIWFNEGVWTFDVPTITDDRGKKTLDHLSGSIVTVLGERGLKGGYSVGGFSYDFVKNIVYPDFSYGMNCSNNKCFNYDGELVQYFDYKKNVYSKIWDASYYPKSM